MVAHALVPHPAGGSRWVPTQAAQTPQEARTAPGAQPLPVPELAAAVRFRGNMSTGCRIG